ncbi:Signal peptidase I [Sinobacterium norvegicum]|uniref:Signal peptidase I n=1 Tax=Sinobacterium norvegicum TaxID=1641715 RepID=A0ABM9ABS4_9GAMM|nr:signal peptidase I [Sinobacterium norvegicum]CAH0990416.1 Signal peptidase I [Sinobacterium norvegicum]
MDINFPLIMVVLVFAGAFIWLVDALFFARQRRQRIESLTQQYPDYQEQGSADQRNYDQAFDSIGKDPVAVEYSKSLTPVLALVLVLRSFIVEPFQIPSGSMEPTLQIGDFILVNKFSYGLRLPVIRTKVWENDEPQRGEVMVFFPPHDPRYFIKRVVGIPGDQIAYKGKQLFVNGEAVEQQLIAQLPVGRPAFADLKENLNGIEHTSRVNLRRSSDFSRLQNQGCVAGLKPDFEITVKAGHFFMMGDNRDNSSDSRCWGQVPEENIVGRAFAIWMHKEPGLKLPTFSRVGFID